MTFSLINYRNSYLNLFPSQYLCYFFFICITSVYGGGPTSVSISEETAVSMLVSWVPPNAHVLQYHVSYTPLTGDARENKVSAPLECCKECSGSF